MERNEFVAFQPGYRYDLIHAAGYEGVEKQLGDGCIRIDPVQPIFRTGFCEMIK
jgi:hypothetical protein